MDKKTSSIGCRVQERSEMYVEEDIVRLKAELSFQTNQVRQIFSHVSQTWAWNTSP